jgi:hypothetical protein
MNLLKKYKYLTVFLVSSGLTSLYLAFGFFRSLWPYQIWFKDIAAIYASTLFPFLIFVVAINVYSLAALIWAKVKKMTMHPIVAIGPAISFTILVGFVLAPYMPSFLPSGSHLQTFDSELWIADDSTVAREGITNRQKMLGDVVENILPGKSRNGIIRLLGLSSDDSHQSTLLFYLGPARGDFFGVEMEWLKVHLDSSGNFEKHEVFRND